MKIRAYKWSSCIPKIIEEEWDSGVEEEVADILNLDELDESTWFGRLAENYSDLPKGTLIVGQNTVENHSFWAITEENVVLYSLDLSDFLAGKFVATRHPPNRAVGADWVCFAESDEQLIQRAKQAALEEWRAPEYQDEDTGDTILAREPTDFEIEFVDAK